MRDDDERYWTTWQRNRHVNRCSAYFDDDPEEQDGGVVFWVMVLIIAAVIAGIVALRIGHLLWSRA